MFNVDLSSGQKQFNLPCGTVCTLDDAIICQPRKNYKRCLAYQSCNGCYQDCQPCIPCLTCQPCQNSFEVKQPCLKCQPYNHGCQPYNICCVKCAPYCPQCCYTIPMVPRECPFPCPTEWYLDCRLANKKNRTENSFINFATKSCKTSCNPINRQNQSNYNTSSSKQNTIGECMLSFNQPLCRQPCEDNISNVRVN